MLDYMYDYMKTYTNLPKAAAALKLSFSWFKKAVPDEDDRGC